jgi:hypothetical protein
MRSTLNSAVGLMAAIASIATAAPQAAPVSETLHYDGGRLALT